MSTCAGGATGSCGTIPWLVIVRRATQAARAQVLLSNGSGLLFLCVSTESATVSDIVRGAITEYASLWARRRLCRGCCDSDCGLGLISLRGLLSLEDFTHCFRDHVLLLGKGEKLSESKADDIVIVIEKICI